VTNQSVLRRVDGAGRQDGTCTLTVCRGCCCGNPRTRPGIDHAGQLDRLRVAAAESDGRLAVRTTDCLGPCDQGNIIVVHPSAEGRRNGGRTTWLGFALGDACTDDLLNWATAGGPGVAEPPATLEPQVIQPPGETKRRSRRRGRARR
jgi:hypothetical protein